MTPALAAWEQQKKKPKQRLHHQKEVAAGVFEPDWDASSSSSKKSIKGLGDWFF